MIKPTTPFTINDEPQYNKYIKYGITLLLLVMPVLNQYSTGSIEPQAIFLAAAIAVCTLFYGIRKIDKLLIAYAVYIVAESMINTYFLGTAFSGRFMFRFVYFAVRMYFLFCLCHDVIDLHFLYKAYKVCVIVIFAGLIVQYIYYAYSGSYLTMLIPDASLNYGYENTQHMVEFNNTNLASDKFRPSSIFLEPAHFSKYVIPCLALSLGELDYRFKTRTFVFAILATLAILLTTSTIGVALALILWGVFFAKEFILSGKNNKAKIILALVAAIALITAVLICVPSIADETIKKYNSILHPTTVSSFSIRFLRGPAVVSQFKLVNIIFGCGWGNLTDYITINNISTIYDLPDVGLGAVNGIFVLIAFSGIIGLAVFLFYVAKKILDVHNFSSILLTLAWILILCVAYYVDTPLYMLALGILIALKNTKAEEIYG